MIRGSERRTKNKKRERKKEKELESFFPSRGRIDFEPTHATNETNLRCFEVDEGDEEERLYSK